MDNHIKRKFFQKGKIPFRKHSAEPVFEKITNKTLHDRLSLYVHAENKGLYQNTVAKKG